MKHFLVACFTAFLFCLVVAVALAQEPAPARKPTPEHEKLGYFVGTWTAEGNLKPSSFGPGTNRSTASKSKHSAIIAKNVRNRNTEQVVIASVSKRVRADF